MGLKASLCCQDPKLLSIFPYSHPMHINVLFTCLLPRGYKVAATAAGIMPSYKCPKHEGEKG